MSQNSVFQSTCLPTGNQLQALLDDASAQPITITSNHENITSEATCSRLVAFGENLDGQKLSTVLSDFAAEIKQDLTVTRYQPLEHMRPAIVVEGFINCDELKPLVMGLAERLDIELTIVDNPPLKNKPGVLLMDMDSTAIQIECIDEIAALAGVGEQVAEVTKRAMQGELDFAQSLHQRVATLEGADEGVLKQVADTMPLMPGLESLVAHLKSQGWVVAIASGGFTYFTERLKARLGLTATFANVLEINDGKLTGKVLGDVVDAKVKADVVAKLAVDHNIPSEQTVAIGDGANDLLMLGQAALGVAFHAKPLVRQKARSAVNQGSLEQLLYLLK